MTQTNYFGTKCPKAGFGEAPQQAFLPHDGAKISSVFTPELLAKNASVATLALLAVSASPGKPREKTEAAPFLTLPPFHGFL